MASAIDSAQRNNDGSVSYFQKTVCLYDWWLVKADKDFEGKQLAVAGLTSRRGEAVRTFVSAPIVKRYDVFSLLTADGIYILLKGLINKLRCSENGFPAEVFNKFLFGFPRGWECYAVNCFAVELAAGVDSGSGLISNSSEIGPEFSSSVVENSSPASLRSDLQEKSSGNNEKPILEESHNVSEMGQGNAASGNVSNKFSAEVQNIEICDQKKTASGSPFKHPDKKQNPTSESLENFDSEKLNSPRTPIQSRGDIDESSEDTPVQPWKETNMPSKQLVGEVASSALRSLLANTEGQNKRTSVRGLVAKKRMTSSAPAGIKRKIVIGKEKSESLENSSREKLNSPRTPIQSRGDVDESLEKTPVCPQKETNMPSKQLVEEFASIVSRPLPANTEGQNKRRSTGCGLAAEKRMTSSAPAGIKRKIVVGKDESNNKTESLSANKINKRSRSGRLLLPPLEFWRNQIPVYNLDHEIVEIRDGPLVESPCRDRGSQSRKKQRQ